MGLIDRYHQSRDGWLASAAAQELQGILQDRCRNLTTTIDTCVLLGSGSPSISPDAADTCDAADKCDAANTCEYRSRAMIQIIIFVEIAKAIATYQDSKPLLIAQDPIYAKCDKAFLRSLGIHTVNDPKAFDLISPRSFAFCPGAEQFVSLRIVAANPAIYLGSDWITDVENESAVIFVESTSDEESGAMTEEDRAETKAEFWAEHAIRSERIQKMATAFAEDKDLLWTIPHLKFDTLDYSSCFEVMYWRRPDATSPPPRIRSWKERLLRQHVSHLAKWGLNPIGNPLDPTRLTFMQHGSPRPPLHMLKGMGLMEWLRCRFCWTWIE